MTKEELLQDLKGHMARTVHTWEDWYRYIDLQTKIAFQSELPPLIVSVTAQMYAFLQAMREMPDEGDITILVSRTCHILVMEIDKRIGVEFAHLLVGDRAGEAPTEPPTEPPQGATPSQEVADLIADLIRRSKG